MAGVGADEHVHADFGSGLWQGSPIGIPITVVPGSQAKTRVTFDYADESDRGPYPIPANVRIEGGSDRHALIVDRDRCRLYELYALERRAGGRWHAGSGAIWNLRSNKLRPAGWTSADAAGLPILPGLARYDEVARGRIDHALRFTVERSRRAYVYPARHFASDETDPSLPPMGLRFRLKASYPIARLPTPGSHRARGAQALRDDRRRQRLELVRQRRSRSALVERRPAHAAPRAGLGLRGGRYVVAQTALSKKARDSRTISRAMTRRWISCVPS